ncbi:cytochrome b561 and DOMON domain-containing protein At5g47530-like [Humulus lupulus]|uniref:cytochrome b561 and DOMON domain-containing protein At5g47530-like n=1 Tax=Humulus lupulus TaxID=3486 RepID=UPI002B409AA4|nr:cytochrome b561 and DOMON domain-containing protein At5g47530-like [Humulus lupulus]
MTTSFKYCLIIFIWLIIHLHCIIATSSMNMIMDTKLFAYSSDHQRNEDTEVTTNLRSWRGQSNLRHPHLRNAYEILIIIGWGTLLPVGVIIARYFSKFPIQWNEWYSYHIMCQSAGYVFGSLGWLIGILVGHNHELKSHQILGIIIFTLTTVQMVAIFWQPKREEEYDHCCRKSWEIYHRLMGYVLIGLIIADIFIGIINQNQSTKWKWSYVAILVILALTSVSLEIYRWVKSKIIQQAVELNSEMYTST